MYKSNSDLGEYSSPFLFIISILFYGRQGCKSATALLLNAMLNMKKVFPLIILLILISCHLFRENGIDFKIVNNSGMEITNVKFYTSEQYQMAEFDKIEAAKSVSGFLSMKNNQADGNYILEFMRSDGRKEIQGAGYYTNGGSLNSWIRFEIKPDTIKVKFGEF